MKFTLALIAVLPAALAVPGHARFEVGRRQATQPASDLTTATTATTSTTVTDPSSSSSFSPTAVTDTYPSDLTDSATHSTTDTVSVSSNTKTNNTIYTTTSSSAYATTTHNTTNTNATTNTKATTNTNTDATSKSVTTGTYTDTKTKNTDTYTDSTSKTKTTDIYTDATSKTQTTDVAATLPTTGIPAPPTVPGTGPIPTVNPNAVCVPPQYQCRYDTGANVWGWDVCTTGFQWTNGGSCKTGEICVYNALSHSPYCVPSGNQLPPTGGGGNNDNCPSGKYRCAYDSLGHSGWSIQSCGSNGNWQYFTECEAGKFCTYSPVAGYPYCKAPDGSGSGGGSGSGVGSCSGQTSVCFPGTYQCAYDYSKNSWGWQVCNVAGSWVWGGNCPTGKTCSFNNLNGSPYCL